MRWSARISLQDLCCSGNQGFLFSLGFRGAPAGKQDIDQNRTNSQEERPGEEGPVVTANERGCEAGGPLVCLDQVIEAGGGDRGQHGEAKRTTDLH